MPEDPSLYKNPFGDVDKNSDYYISLLTLANFIGKNSDGPVLTHKFGVFNPLRNVTRAEFVKMVIESFDFPLNADESILNKFSDYNDPNMKGFEKYFAKAVKLGIIVGDVDQNGKRVLDPNRKLFLSEGLLILSRVNKYPVETISKDMFLPALLTKGFSNSIGYISEIVNYNPNATPIKIGTIDTSSATQIGCVKLTANLQAYDKNDQNLNTTYFWQSNSGFFKPLSNDSFKSVEYCFPTRKIQTGAKIRLVVSDGLGNFDSSTKILDYKDAYQQENIYDKTQNNIESKVQQDGTPLSKMKEGELYDTRIFANIEKTGLNIGIESASIDVEYNGKIYDTIAINNLAPGKSIKFIAPSIPDLYGKNINLLLTIATNTKGYIKTIKNVLYNPRYVIYGKVDLNKDGTYPQSVKIGGVSTKIGEDGSFLKVLSDGGKYPIYINDNYETEDIDLTITDPTAFVPVSYIDKDDNSTQIYTDSNNTVEINSNSNSDNNNTRADSNGNNSDIVIGKDSNDNNLVQTNSNSNNENNNIEENSNNTSNITGIDSNDKNNISSVDINSTRIELHKGWNLISMQEKDFIKFDYDNFITSIWGYKNNKWYAYSHNDTIYSKIYSAEIPQLKETNSDDGVWILSQKDANITVKNQPVKDYNIHKGWNLLGTNKKIKTSIFDNSCVSYLWQYDTTNKQWKLYRSDGIDKYFGYDKFMQINANSGFWAYGKGKCDITIDSIEGNATNNNEIIQHNSLTYGTITSPYTGRVWLDRNLGAKRVCQSMDDEQCFGNLYQWGRKADGHQNPTSLTTIETASNYMDAGHGKFIVYGKDYHCTWLQYNIDKNGTKESKQWSKIDGSSICPIGFRVPTLGELQAELGKNGAKVKNAGDVFASFLKLPANYYRSEYGNIEDSPEEGSLWTSTSGMGLEWDQTAMAIKWNSFAFFDGVSHYRMQGRPVRCIKDNIHSIIKKKTVILKDGNISKEYVASPGYGHVFQTYMGIKAYANNLDYSGLYQCTDLVKRFYQKVFNIKPFSSGDGQYVASKYDGKKGKYNGRNIILKYYKNLSSIKKPINGSIISFDTGNGIGHVAIAKKVSCNNKDTKCSVYLFEQNYSYTIKNKTYIAHSRKITFTKLNGKWSGDTVVGWTNPLYSN